MLPVIALVGRPNVGKSTLFNILTQSRDALVADYPGLTRDRKYGHGKFRDHVFIVVDTGGLSGESEHLDRLMAEQTQLAIDEANLVLFMVDAHDGLTAADEEINHQLRLRDKNVHLVINKTDKADTHQAIAEFATLGLAHVHAISAAHNRGTRKLVDDLLGDWPFESAEENEAASDDGIRVAVVGKPNVGKSTLVNRLIGEERVVVMDMPGTTRDSILVPFERNGQKYTLIDTAGVRRRKNVKETVEKFSVIKTLQAIDQSNVSMLLIDAHEGISDQDLHLLGYIIDSGRALVVVVNKWDSLHSDERQRIRTELDMRLRFTRFAEMHFISALHGSGVGHLFKAITQAYRSAMVKLSTPHLTRVLDEAVQQHQPPLVRGRRIKLRYAHQGGQNPPVIVIHGNQTEHVPAAYKRYLMNWFLDELKVSGTPLRLEFKTSDNPFSGRKNVLTERQQFRRNKMIRHIKQNEKKKKYKKRER